MTRRLSAAERADRRALGGQRARNEMLPYEERRNVRVRDVPARTEDTSRLSKRHLLVLAAQAPEDALTVAMRAQRPRTRGDCIGGPRPCPWASCRYHLALDLSDEGHGIKFNFPDAADDFSDLPETCALDVAEQGDVTLEQVGEYLNVTRERIRQIEISALSLVHGPMGELLDSPSELRKSVEAHADERKRREYLDKHKIWNKTWYARKKAAKAAAAATQATTQETDTVSAGETDYDDRNYHHTARD